MPQMPEYDPTQPIPPWLGGADPFQLPTGRPRTILENGAFRLMALYPGEVSYTPADTEYPARHALHIATENGNGLIGVLSGRGVYRGLVISGELIEGRMGKGGSVSSSPSGEVAARKFSNPRAALDWKVIALDESWHRLVPPPFRTANYLARLLRNASPALPPPQPRQGS